jgi:hypothetical protein
VIRTQQETPRVPLYLSGVANPVLEPHADRESLGLMVGPGGGTYSKVGAYGLFAADNGCFSKGDSFDANEWLTFLDQLPRESCLLATAPDVVGDAAATLERSAEWLPVIRSMGFPAALVAQDGLEDLEVPWDTFDVLFIGGSTEWKLSDAAADLMSEAKLRGKWVHVGRVNSFKRVKWSVANGADSMDGTFLAFGPKTNLPRLLTWLDFLESNRRDEDLEEVAA